jgi:hypothetical protein
MMTCQEDVVPVFVIVTITVIFILLVNAFLGFTVNEQQHKNRLKKGLSWNTSITEYTVDLDRIKKRYGNVLYYVSYGYVILTIKIFDHPYKSLIVTAIFLLVGLRLLLAIC